MFSNIKVLIIMVNVRRLVMQGEHNGEIMYTLGIEYYVNNSNLLG